VSRRFHLRGVKGGQKRFTGFIARIFQHEYDHLKGIVFLDRIKNSKDLITESEYQKLINLAKPRIPKVSIGSHLGSVHEATPRECKAKK